MRLTVVGAGPAGLAAAVWGARLGASVTLYEAAAEPGGQLRDLSLPVVDVPGLTPRPASELVEALVAHVWRVGGALHCGVAVTGWDPEGFLVADGQRLPLADRILVAPGTVVRRLGVPGEELASPMSVSQFLKSAVPGDVAVVGGGDRALEAAVRLQSAGHRTLLLHRRVGFRARPDLLARAATAGVEIVAPAKVVSLARDPAGAVAVTTRESGEHRVHRVTAVFLRIGMEAHPLAAAALQWPHARLAGDAWVPPRHRSIVTAYATAMQAAKDLLVPTLPEGN
jgi:thioredoxin reductase (NADPH)